MMKKVGCNVVKDLLPSYMDNLTSEESNTLIKKHLEECESCRGTYNIMNDNINIHYDIDHPEVTYMKKVHKKFIIMSVCIIILIAIICMGIYAMNYITSYAFLNGKVYKGEYSVSNNTYLFIEYEDENAKTTFIVTIDENNICQNTRKITESKTTEGEKQLNEEYNMIDMFDGDDTMHTNYELKDSKLYYNYNVWNGLEKDKIILQLAQYHAEDNLSIIEY